MSFYDNPMQTDGFEFVEFSNVFGDLNIDLGALFTKMGFIKIAHHRYRDIDLYRQGKINFLVNKEKESHAASFSKAHGPCASSMAFRVKDAQYALKRAVQLGAKEFKQEKVHTDELSLLAIEGIGGSLLYFVDQYIDKTIYDINFEYLPNINKEPNGYGLSDIDHLTHNVYYGNMGRWVNFYEKIFNFREIRYFDISGKKTGLLSRALASPCNKIRIPINESPGENSQIVEYLNLYKGEGIQHIALLTSNISKSVQEIKNKKIPFLTISKTYYDVINKRLPNHGLNLKDLSKDNILIDGEIDKDKKDLLLQIFTKTVVGPIFFELIQRMGHEGFGEGNFTALFETMELDQIERGVL